MELGPLQKQWVQSLREHPERQLKNALGRGEPESYRACCLGELHVLGCQFFHEPPPFDKGTIVDDPNDETEDAVTCLGKHYEKYGLRALDGMLNVMVDKVTWPRFKSYNGPKQFASLAGMNDGGLTWVEIADYIENNPDNVFTKSV